MSSKPRSRLLSCFGCGLAGPFRSGSGVATSRIVDESVNAPGSLSASDTVCDKTAGKSAFEVVSRLPTASSARQQPSYAFGEQTRQGCVSPDTPVNMATATFEGASRNSEGASATVNTRDAVDSGGDCTKGPARRRGRKPRVSTSRVSPAYDTEDELSPAAGISRTPSGSAGSSSSPAYSASLPSLEPPPLQGDGVQENDIIADPALKHGGGGGGGSFTIEDIAAGTVACGQTAAGSSLSREEHASHPGAVCSESFKKSVSSTSSAAVKSTAGIMGSVHGRSSALTASVPSAAAAPDELNDAPRSAAPRSLNPVSSTGATMDVSSTAASRSSRSGEERLGPERGYGGGDGAGGAVGNLVSEPDSPRAIFTRHGMDCPSATTAVVVTNITSVISGPVAADDSTLSGSNGAGGSAAVRRSSFAGDSSTSLVGPGNVSETPTLQHCPSLRVTTSSVPTPQEQQHEQQQQQQTLGYGSTESLQHSPLPPPPLPPPTLQTYGSLRLNPLPPQRQLTISPSLRPTPLLLPSPSISHSAPQQEQLLPPFPGCQSVPESAPARMSASGDTMLRLPPPQPPLFQHGPSSFGRGSYPRPHALAPLLRASAPGDDPSALTRLTSLQAAFREKRLHEGEEEEVGQPSATDGRGGTTAAAAMATATDGTSASPPPPTTTAVVVVGGHRLTSGTNRAEKQKLGQKKDQPSGATATAAVADDRAVATAAAVPPTSFEFGVAAGAAIAGDAYDNAGFCGDDVDSMVEELLPLSSSYRSSAAPAMSSGCSHGMHAKGRDGKQHHTQQQRMAFLEQQPRPLHAADTGVYADGALASEMVSEPQPESLLGAYAPKWLEELLPPSPGYGTERPCTRIGGARPNRIIVAAPDSFRNLLREIE